jgi:hypothetical protein
METITPRRPRSKGPRKAHIDENLLDFKNEMSHKPYNHKNTLNSYYKKDSMKRFNTLARALNKKVPVNGKMRYAKAKYLIDPNRVIKPKTPNEKQLYDGFTELGQTFGPHPLFEAPPRYQTYAEFVERVKPIPGQRVASYKENRRRRQQVEAAIAAAQHAENARKAADKAFEAAQGLVQQALGQQHVQQALGQQHVQQALGQQEQYGFAY